MRPDQDPTGPAPTAQDIRLAFDQARGGDCAAVSGAVGVLYAWIADDLRKKLGCFFGQDSAGLDDCCQEFWLKVLGWLENPVIGDGEDARPFVYLNAAALRGFLLGKGVYLAKDLIRKQAVQRERVAAVPDFAGADRPHDGRREPPRSVSSEAAAEEARKVLSDPTFLSKLDKEQRDIWRWWYLEGWPHSKIGEELGISSATARTRVYRVRKLVKEAYRTELRAVAEALIDLPRSTRTLPRRSPGDSHQGTSTGYSRRG